MSSKQAALWRFAFPKTALFAKYLALILTYSLGVLWFDDNYFPKKQFMEADASMITSSVVIGLLLVFRTNSAYERWWEARKLWGQLVNDLRNLRIKFEVIIDSSAQEKERFRRLLIAFPYALKDHLRGQKRPVGLPELDSRLENIEHLPFFIDGLIQSTIFAFRKTGKIDGFQWLDFDPHLRALMDICGACERIKLSPITGSYKCLIWIWLTFYLLVIPWILVPIIDIWAIPATLMGSYFVIGIELLAEEVEEPFGTECNDLPLETICKTIETSINMDTSFASVAG